MQLPLVVVQVGDDAELAVAGADGVLARAAYGAFVEDAVVDQVGHAAQGQAVTLGEIAQRLATSRFALFVENADQHGGRHQAGEPRQVAGRFHMAGPLHHATGLGTQGENVTGLHQVGGAAGRVHGDRDGAGAVGSGNAGGHSVACLYGQGETHAVAGPRVGYHELQAEGLAALLGQGKADQPARLARHEVDGSGIGMASGNHQRTFALPLIVGHHQHGAAGHGFDQSLRAVHFRFLSSMPGAGRQPPLPVQTAPFRRTRPC
ncbi:hypothetical protein D9M68_388630 [compost metagenome]